MPWGSQRGSSIANSLQSLTYRSKINVLVEEFGRALLCDFGLARIKADITSRTRAMSDSVVSGSRNWMAPELLSGSLPRPQSDIYAFGMTLYEVRIVVYRSGILINSCCRFTPEKSPCQPFLTGISSNYYSSSV
jgi:serine/threonine protein kinase